MPQRCPETGREAAAFRVREQHEDDATRFFGAVTVSGANTGVAFGRILADWLHGEVLAAMGTPTSTTASEGVEVLNYSLDAKRALFSTDFDSYYVRLVNGQVESYGKTDELKKNK